MDVRPFAIAGIVLLGATTVAGTATYHHYVSGPIGPRSFFVGGYGRVDPLTYLPCSDAVALALPAANCYYQYGQRYALDGHWGGTDLNENGVQSSDPAGGYVWAAGTCEVERESTLIAQTNGDFWFLCGVDRDDDGAVTNADGDGSSDPDGFDDDFVIEQVDGQLGRGSAILCFRADRTATGTANGGKAGAAWDMMDAVIGMNVPQPTMAAGTFRLDISLTTSNTDTCGSVSGHSHGAWYG